MTKQENNFNFEDVDKYITQERREELKEKAEAIGKNELAGRIVCKVQYTKLQPKILHKEALASEKATKDYLGYKERESKFNEWIIKAKGEIIDQDGECKLIMVPEETYKKGLELFFTEEEVKRKLNFNISDEEIEAYYKKYEEDNKAYEECNLYFLKMLDIPEPKTVYEELYYTKIKYEAGIKRLAEEMEKLAEFQEELFKSREIMKIILDLGFDQSQIFNYLLVAEKIASKVQSFRPGSKSFKKKDLVAEEVLTLIRKKNEPGFLRRC